MINNIKKMVVSLIPKPVVKAFVFARNRMRSKDRHELDFWRSRYKIDGGVFVNSHFEKCMLQMAEEKDDSFLAGKVVADFGCGPKGQSGLGKIGKIKNRHRCISR
jgi:hypothetical protein